jgi:hypothetical protein
MLLVIHKVRIYFCKNVFLLECVLLLNEKWRHNDVQCVLLLDGNAVLMNAINLIVAALLQQTRRTLLLRLRNPLS